MSEDKISAYRRRKDARKHEALKDDIVEKWRARKDERQKGNAYYNYKKRRAVRKAEREDARWITIGAVAPDERRGTPGSKGRHVLIDDEGKIVSGAGGSLTGVKLTGAESTSGDVKVDPKKTSDPLPTSPAGEAGKSAGEVASEAKGGEGESGKGEEPKKEPEKKFDFEAAKKALGSADIEGWDEWLKNAPIGTGVIFDDGAGVRECYKEEKGWRVNDKDLVSSAAMSFADDATFEAYLEKGGGINIVDPETGEVMELVAKGTGETESGKFDIHDFESVIHDEDNSKLTDWLENAPTGTKLYYTVSGDEIVAEKDKWGTWHERFVGDMDDGYEFDKSEDFMKELKLTPDYTDFEVVDADGDEKITVKGIGEKPSDEEGEGDDIGSPTEWLGEFEDAWKEKSSLKEWAKKVPEGTAVALKDKDGKVFMSFEKDSSGWAMKDADGNVYYLGDGAVADWITSQMASAAKWQASDKKSGVMLEQDLSAVGEEEADFGAVKDFIDSGDNEALEGWMEDAPEGTSLVIKGGLGGAVLATMEKEVDGSWTSKVTGTAFVNTYDDPSKAADEFMKALKSTGTGWDAVDGATGEVLSGEVADKGEESGEKEGSGDFDIEDFKEKVKYGGKPLDDAIKALPIGTSFTYPGGSTFTKKDDGKYYLEGYESLGSVDIAHFLDSALYPSVDIKDPKTGEWVAVKGEGVKSSGTALPTAADEPDKPYKAKDDFGTIVTVGGKDDIASRLDKMDEGAVIEFDRGEGYTKYRHIKKDGKWRREMQLPDGTWKESYTEAAKTFADLFPYYLQNSDKMKVNGKEVKTLYHHGNKHLQKFKNGDTSAAGMVGFNSPMFGATFENAEGKTFTVTKQDDASYIINDGSGEKKISYDNLVRKIKNDDMWFKSVYHEESWSGTVQNMLKKNLAPLKKSLFSAPDKDAFRNTMRLIDARSTFQMRNTDGNGFMVRKFFDDGEHSSYMVTEIDGEGHTGKRTVYGDHNIDELFKKLSSAAKKGVQFTNDLKPLKYVPPEKKSSKKAATVPPDTTVHATEGTTPGGLSKVSFGEDAYSDAARKGAIEEPRTYVGMEKVHSELFPGMKKWWKGLTSTQKAKTKEYTSSYHDTNEPLRGFSYAKYSSGKDATYITDKIKAIDSALDKSMTEKPIVLTRGISWGTLRAMVDHKSSSYGSGYKKTDYGTELVGKELTDPSFLSCTAAGAADFDSKPVQLKIYCPAGTKGAYVYPVSHYGMGLEDPEKIPAWTDVGDGSEFEFLLQRGCKFKVRDVKKSGGQLHLELDLVEQNPRSMKVVGTKCEYDDGKDAYDF